jgi:hypothetical protein
MKLVIKRISSAFELGLIDAQRVRPVSARARLRPSPFRMVVRKELRTSPAAAGLRPLPD